MVIHNANYILVCHEVIHCSVKKICLSLMARVENQLPVSLNPKFSSLAHTGGGFFQSFFQVHVHVILAVVRHFRFNKVKKKVGNMIPIRNSLLAFLIG